MILVIQEIYVNILFAMEMHPILHWLVLPMELVLLLINVAVDPIKVLNVKLGIVLALIVLLLIWCVPKGMEPVQHPTIVDVEQVTQVHNVNICFVIISLRMYPLYVMLEVPVWESISVNAIILLNIQEITVNIPSVMVWLLIKLLCVPIEEVLALHPIIVSVVPIQQVHSVNTMCVEVNGVMIH